MNDIETVKRDGKVALKQIGSNIPRPVKVDDVVYVASPQHNVWLMWVEESHAERILNSPQNKIKSCDCGGGAYRDLFKYASVLDVSLYDTGDRPR